MQIEVIIIIVIMLGLYYFLRGNTQKIQESNALSIENLSKLSIIGDFKKYFLKLPSETQKKFIDSLDKNEKTKFENFIKSNEILYEDDSEETFFPEEIVKKYYRWAKEQGLVSKENRK